MSTGSSDVSPFLGMCPLNSAFFAFKTYKFINLKPLVYTNLFYVLQQCLAELCARAFLNDTCIAKTVSLV